MKRKSKIFSAVVAGLLMTTAVAPAAQADPTWRHGGYHHDMGPRGNAWGHYKKHKRPVVYREVKTVHVVHHDAAPVRTSAPASSGLDISNTTGGTIIGAILGAVAGTQIGKGSGRTAAILGGAVIGGILGNKVGQNMDRNDLTTFNNTLESAPTGRSVSWVNPDSGNRYDVTPTRTYRTRDGRDCRDYTTWAVIDGYEEEVTGTACRQSDGTWVADAS
ncbi:MAG: RT0821/Lpp0805 family surface protein [Rhodospirillales bacterium]